MIISCFIFQILAIQSGFYSTILKSPIYYIPIALFGISFYLLISFLIKNNKALVFIGKNSLIILAFQGPVYRLVIKFFSIILKITVDDIRYNIMYNIVITVISLIIIMPIINLYNSYVRNRINKLFATQKKLAS